MEKEFWRSRTGFILAALGSAIGLGNVWRFPYMAYKNGGGAFLIPYVVALLVVGFCLLLAELYLGHRFRASQPFAFRQGRRGWEAAGWWAIAVGLLGVTLYYCVIIGWTVNYFFYSFGLSWNPDPEPFFNESFLGLTAGPFSLGGLRWPIVLSTALAWGTCWWIVGRGIARGIEFAIMGMMPLLGLILIVMVFWTLTLPGAEVGIAAYLRPDFSKLLEPRVWGDAVGQTFFSIGLGFGIMVAYARYLPERSNLPGNVLWILVGDTLFAIIAGFVVFGTLGFMAHQAKVSVDSVAKAGPGLVFVVFPKAISQFPLMRPVFGALFFLALFIAGISSAISLLEALVSALQDKFGAPRKRLVSFCCVLGFLGSLVYTTGAGLYWLDIVDHHVTQYGLVTASVLVALFAGWVLDEEALLEHLRKSGVTWVGVWWPRALRYLVPLLLLVLLLFALYADLKKTYGGYSFWAILLLGWGWLAVLAAVSNWVARRE